MCFVRVHEYMYVCVCHNDWIPEHKLWREGVHYVLHGYISCYCAVKTCDYDCDYFPKIEIFAKSTETNGRKPWDHGTILTPSAYVIIMNMSIVSLMKIAVLSRDKNL